MNKINVAEKFALFSEHWKPQIIGELNDSYVKAVKFKGDFLWHHHDNEDELFFVVKGLMRMWIQENGPDSAREIAAFPQLCVRTDRRSAYEQVDLGLAEALQNELQHGNRVLAAGARFTASSNALLSATATDPRLE